MDMYDRPLYMMEEEKNATAGQLKKLIFEIFEELDEMPDSGPVSREAAVASSSGIKIDIMDIADMMAREIYTCTEESHDFSVIIEGPENPMVRAGIIADRLQDIKECSADDMLIEAINEDTNAICQAIEDTLVAKYALSYCQEIVKVIPEYNELLALCVASGLDTYLTSTALMPLFPSIEELLEKIRALTDGGIDDYFDDDEDEDEVPVREKIFAAVSVPEEKREEFMTMVREKDDDDEYVLSNSDLNEIARRMMLEESE